MLSPAVWLLFFIGVYYFFKNISGLKWLFYLISLTLLYLILESSAIDIYHDCYLFPFLPWLYVLVAFGVEKIRNYMPVMKYLLIAFCIVGFYYTYKKTEPMWSIEESNFNKDVFLYREDLKKAAPRDAKCIIMNDVSNYIFSYQIDKMGYIFKDDYLPAGWVYDMVKNNGVEYMYSDSKKVNTDPEMAKYIEKVIMVRGSISVFKLKSL